MEPKVLETYLKKKLKENCISSVIKIVDGNLNIPKGENYCSDITRYRVEYVNNCGEKAVKNIIIKNIPPAKEQKAFFQEISFYKSEIKMYANTLKLLQNLMEEFEDRRERLWCEVVAYKPFEMLALQDLKDENFQMLDRKQCLDFEHSMLVMRSLARFHAMSRILLKRLSIDANDFQQLAFTKDWLITLFFISSIKVLEEAIAESWGEQWKNFPEKLKKVRSIAHEKLANLVKVDESRFNVINHGDCWGNNIMFKHVEGTDTPCALRFIDFQVSHYNSFGWDLTYFLYNSTHPVIRRSKFKELLKAYQESLRHNLEFFNYQGDDVPTFDEVVDEMERLKFFGFILLSSFHAITTTEVYTPFDIQTTLKNLDNPRMGIKIEMFTDHKYKNRVEEDLRTIIKDIIN